MSQVLPEDPDEVRIVAEALLGPSEGAVDRVASFAGSRVFRVRASGRVLFFKFGSDADIAREAAALGLAAGAGVPTPTVEAVDRDQAVSPHPLIVLAEVPGAALDAADPAFPAVGALMTRWHRIRLEGFGVARPDQRGGLRGEDSTWTESLRRRVAGASAAVETGLVPGHLIERAGSALESAPVPVMETGRFLHGDFHARHVFAAGGQITAVIDWGDAAVGDPDYDLARVLHASVLRGGLDLALLDLGRLLPGADLRRDSRRLMKLLVYAATFVCWSMAGELAGGAPWPPWWPAQCGALEAILDSFDDLAARRHPDPATRET